jgi:glycosyltransferase involved in cell wall biosynthesis
MKVLYLCLDSGIPFAGAKGASVHLRHITTALARAGHSVTTVVARRGGRSAAPVHELPPPASDFWRPEAPWATPGLSGEVRALAANIALPTFLESLPDAAFDLVLERYSLLGFAGLAWARERRIPFVLEANAPLVEEARAHRVVVLEPLARAVEGYLFSRANHVLAVSQSLADHVRTRAPATAVTVLPNGVEPDLFPHDAAEPAVRERFAGPGEFLVGFVGSLKPWHGVDVLLEAFRLLPASEGFRLAIVGEGPERARLEAQTQALGLSNRVVFTGAVAHEEVPALLAAMDAVAAPYPEMEEFYFSPLKVFEYMMAARPIVASRIGQVAGLLRDGVTALLVKPGAREELTAALLRLRTDPQLGRRLARAARAEAREKHTWTARVRILEPILTSLAACAEPA